MKSFRILSGPFRGTPILTNLKNGKRKILGIYEHETNAWWSSKLESVDLFYDVGAADGFFTRGLAHRMRQKSDARIIAFEPGMHLTDLGPSGCLNTFSSVAFDFVPQLVGDEETEAMTTLDTHYLAPQNKALVKIDVEGAELNVLAGASKMLEDSDFEWIIEIHGRDLIDSVSIVFERIKRNYRIIEPKPHWLFGAENRMEWTGWLVTT